MIVVFFLAYLGRGFHKEPSSSISGMKIAFFTIGCTGFVLFSMYQSYLSASLIVKTTKPPVNNIEDVIEFPHKLVMSKGGSVHKMFLNANPDSLYGKIRESGKIETTKRDTAWIEEVLKSNNYDKINHIGKNTIFFFFTFLKVVQRMFYLLFTNQSE